MHRTRPPAPHVLVAPGFHGLERQIHPPSRPRADPDALVGLACLLLLPLALLLA